MFYYDTLFVLFWEDPYIKAADEHSGLMRKAVSKMIVRLRDIVGMWGFGRTQ